MSWAVLPIDTELFLHYHSEQSNFSGILNEDQFIVIGVIFFYLQGLAVYSFNLQCECYCIVINPVNVIDDKEHKSVCANTTNRLKRD